MYEMKVKNLAFVVAAIVMAACSSNKVQGDDTEIGAALVDSVVKPIEASEVSEARPKAKESSMWTEKAVEKQIQACFEEVNKMAASDGIDIGLLDNKYCSKDYLELKGNLEKKIQKGEVMFEGDHGHHWTAGIATPIFVDSLKAELMSKEQAQAEVWLKDSCDNRGYMELELYLEDGAWKIHNWIDTDVYPFGALFNWMQSVYDGETDDEEKEEEE
jgi:hypothetical protein